MKILALDPATKCGWAHRNGIVTSGTWDLSVRRDESTGMRLIRLQSKLQTLYDSVGIDLLVYEAARNAAPKMQGALVIQATLQGVFVAWATERGIEYRGYSPSEIKKHATGVGNAGKPAMMAAAQKLGYDPVDDNEADALLLLTMAVEEYGEACRAVR